MFARFLVLFGVFLAFSVGTVVSSPTLLRADDEQATRSDEKDCDDEDGEDHSDDDEDDGDAQASDEDDEDCRLHPVTEFLLAFVAAEIPGSYYWGGTDYSAGSHSQFGGIGYAFSGDATSEGWHVRLSGGEGHYFYDDSIFVASPLPGRPPRQFDLRRHGVVSFADLLLGYQFRDGGWTSKILVGATYAEHFVKPFDADNPVQGETYGVKVVTENWINLWDGAFAQVDASYTTAFDTYRVDLRVGHRIFWDVSIGLEAAALGNAAYDGGRFGVFISGPLFDHQIRLSGGVSSDYAETTGTYAQLVSYRAF